MSSYFYAVLLHFELYFILFYVWLVIMSFMSGHVLEERRRWQEGEEIIMRKGVNLRFRNFGSLSIDVGSI